MNPGCSTSPTTYLYKFLCYSCNLTNGFCSTDFAPRVGDIDFIREVSITSPLSEAVNKAVRQ